MGVVILRERYIVPILIMLNIRCINQRLCVCLQRVWVHKNEINSQRALGVYKGGEQAHVSSSIINLKNYQFYIIN